MQWTVPQTLDRTFVTLGVVGVAAGIIWIIQSSKRPNLDVFPTVGSSGLWGGIEFLTNTAAITREGYRKYKGAPFKVATPYRWAVVIGSRAHIEEVRDARDDELLVLEPILEDFHLEFMIGSEQLRNTHRVASALRLQLTRNLGFLFPEVWDEITTAFDEILDLKDNEWKSVPALATVRQVVCRASNRAFVGLPLCRNPDFIALNIQYAMNVTTTGGIIMGFLPTFLRALAFRCITYFLTDTIPGVEHLRPIIEERRKHLSEYGSEWDEKPRDLLSWVMDEAGLAATAESITSHMLMANFAAIHTSSNVFTIVLYNLAANPQYVQPLREEVETIVEKEGWSKVSLGKMHRIDSFLKETMRVEGIENLSLMRKAGKDFMFSDGTLIPKGTRIYAPVAAIHLDDALYENPEVFDPFRFAVMGKDDDEGERYQFAATSTEYLLFGHGRHACPGRFFAAAELKLMLAYIVTTYDVKMEGDTGRPSNVQNGAQSLANPKARVMFRKRVRQDVKH